MIVYDVFLNGLCLIIIIAIIMVCVCVYVAMVYEERMVEQK